mmetsp:Transcript_26903/g.62433  ORF Transcript_26903/g.62433 Transcript_26903/m.62433 type:complete len:281 (+) Transcript_26903:119-961(+)
MATRRWCSSRFEESACAASTRPCCVSWWRQVATSSSSTPESASTRVRTIKTKAPAIETNAARYISSAPKWRPSPSPPLRKGATRYGNPNPSIAAHDQTVCARLTSSGASQHVVSFPGSQTSIERAAPVRSCPRRRYSSGDPKGAHAATQAPRARMRAVQVMTSHAREARTSDAIGSVSTAMKNSGETVKNATCNELKPTADRSDSNRGASVKETKHPVKTRTPEHSSTGPAASSGARPVENWPNSDRELAAKLSRRPAMFGSDPRFLSAAPRLSPPPSSP